MELAIEHAGVGERDAFRIDRHLDHVQEAGGVPADQVAEHLGRSLHATETLLVRSRGALRRQYQEGESHG